jgi:predicted glutamine amidotransferase
VCRLFGMSGAPRTVRATFWLIEAPDSLSMQSRREPDGTGLGFFEDGQAQVVKRPIAAYQDQAFAREARTVASTTFVAHVRFASTGGLEMQNTHPFMQENRVFAHNGVIAELDELERELGDYGRLVAGDTDSERFFALITKAIDGHHGDVGRGITAAARWVAERLPLYSLNVILTTPRELWALRFPDTHELWLLDREPGARQPAPGDDQPKRPCPRARARPGSGPGGGAGQRADGREPGLAPARGGRTGARRCGAASAQPDRA